MEKQADGLNVVATSIDYLWHCDTVLASTVLCFPERLKSHINADSRCFEAICRARQELNAFE